MTDRLGRARWRAAGTALLLLVAGAVLGIMADRHLLSRPDTHEMPLTAEALVARLDLTVAEEARLRTVLDSLHADMAGVVQQGPDAMGAVARDAHRRIEAALPARVLPAFRDWIREHHDEAMRRMHGTLLDAAGIYRDDSANAHREGHTRRP